MQFGLFAVVVFLIFLEYAGSLSMLKGSRQRRISTDMTVVCSNGCESCSEINGCLKCLPKLFILLERNDIRQKGICLASCPVGYFDLRQPDMNKCIKCKIDNCEACFSKTFCTKCKEGLYLYKGKCYSSCPEGSTALNGTAECNSVVQCELGEWGSWGPCTKRGKQCGFKLGTQNRTREVLQPALSDPALCPSETENRKCTVQKKPCTKRGKIVLYEGSKSWHPLRINWSDMQTVLLLAKKSINDM
ncbi:R-spondin-1 [Polypterus senegalus]|uniref:R-spondin-1 n=1 Tax=Polypterus senegalus TaxID=55291 RepID=UPI001963C9D0|nr:R-spondin-1 [Polypterus senegalus]